MKVFSLFESSLKDPNKLNRIFLRIYGIHKKKFKKKIFKKESRYLRPGARNYGLSFLGLVYM